MKRLLPFLLIASFCTTAKAQTSVRLNNGELPLRSIQAPGTDRYLQDLPVADGKRFFVLQFNGPLTDDRSRQLQQAGIRLHDYIPPFCYTASAASLNAAMLTRSNVSGIGQLNASLKLSALLQRPERYSWLKGANGRLELLVKCSAGISNSMAKQLLQQQGYTITPNLMEPYGILQLPVLSSRINELASLPFVEYVEPVHPADKGLNNRSRDMGRANVAAAPIASGGYDLTGQGVVVGVGDDADPTNHIDLKDRIINRSAFVYNSHGTHVTGTVGGAGIFRFQSKGYAPRSTIVSQLFSGIFLNAAKYVNDHNMVLTNNSYGSVTGDSSYEGVYDLYSQVLDQQAFQFPYLMQVFASGNDGEIAMPRYPLNFGNVLSGYQSAKNVVTVGRTDRTMYASGTSSSGPVKDGRLKPELVALGEEIISCAGNGNYASAWGTSQSAPAITGGAALLVEQYRKQFSADPKSGLLKALLMNGGMDIGKPGPDYRHGYGMLNLDRSLNMLQNNRFYTGTIATGGTNDQSITVPSGTAQLKVMLYWHDPAASLFASHTLVNDLDLEVIDASSNITRPQKLDTIPANVANTATTGADHINNSEQVIINNPSGNYTIRVKGTAVNLNSPQEYFVTYDHLAQGLRLTAPFEKDAYWPGDLCVIHWTDNGTPNNQRTLEYSLNNGGSWTTISSTIHDTLTYYNWTIPASGIETKEALIRITENGTGFSATSGPFVILGPLNAYLRPSAQQCEGYMRIYWDKISSSPDLSYDVLLKQGADYVTVATVTDTFYTFSGLSKDTTYWFAIRPNKAGIAGRRTNGQSYLPNTGSCGSGISDGDLKVDAITAPVNGRIGTASALTASTNISIRIKNLDDVAITGFDVKYSINGGAFTSQSVGATIAAGGTYTHTFSGIDLSQPGTYVIRAVVKNAAADPVAKNDTLIKTVKQLRNPAISLVSPFTENFDAAPVFEVSSNQTGLDSLDRWDMSTSTTAGRVRSFVNSGIARSGNRALTLDVNRYIGSGSTNQLTATFDLSAYNTATDEVRLDLNFKQHGSFQQNGSSVNKIFARGSESNAWIEVYDLNSNQPTAAGVWKKTNSIDLAAALFNAVPTQNFSTSTQIRLGQNSALGMGDDEHYGGYTFDDISLYKATDDVELNAITAPLANLCAASATSAVSVLLKNFMSAPITNVPINLQVDGGAVTTETVPSVSIAPSGTAFTFAATANISSFGTHTIKVWTSLATDNVKSNDTLTITINNQPVISSFPYLQDFESNNGNCYAGGHYSSWEYGTPRSVKIRTAASGTKAWKTNLLGNYSDEEYSYLYTPCFNVSGLTNPTLSFNMAYDLEYCRPSSCDGAWVEYSTDGVTWTKLGSYGSGQAWYNNATDQMWDSTKAYWHVATIPLPTGSSSLRLRFVMSSDVFSNADGVAIDDIHVYDKTYDIYESGSNSNTVTQSVSGSSPIHFTDGGQIMATLYPNGSNLGSTAVNTYIFNGAVRNNGQQYFANRNITIKPANVSPSSPPVRILFYFLDKEVDSMRNATGCGTCVPPRDNTVLGVHKYDDPDDNDENGTMADNTGGVYSYLNSSLVRKVPYGKGYYAEFDVYGFSEFWLNDGNDAAVILPAEWVSFTAERTTGGDVLLQWKTTNEHDVMSYEVEVGSGADRGRSFVTLTSVAALNNLQLNEYRYTDARPGKDGILYYRIKRTDRNGSITYSETRVLLFGKKRFNAMIYPVPVKDQAAILLQDTRGRELQLTLLNGDGRILWQRNGKTTGSLQKEMVDMSRFPAGVYLLKLRSGDTEEVMKLVKE